MSEERLFTGAYTNTVDDRGRVAVPSELRTPLIDGFVVSAWTDGGLLVCTQDIWQQMKGVLSEGSLSVLPKRDIERLLEPRSFDAHVDDQGRVLIPPILRTYSGLDYHTKGVFLGLGDHIEIWELRRWRNHEANILTLAQRSLPGLIPLLPEEPLV